MPAHNIDKKDLKSKGYIKVLSGNDYITVNGRLYLAHGIGQLVGVETKELDPDDEKYIIIQARVTVLNERVFRAINDASISADIPDSVKPSIIAELGKGLYGTYYGQSQNLRESSGKAAKNTSPREDCETSAIGRALGAAGFGDVESYASYEEVVIANERRAATSKSAAAAKSKEPVPF